MSTASAAGTCGGTGAGQTPDAPAARPPVDPDRCPRCGGGFACGMSGDGPCPCTTVTLPAATLAALQARYDGCLCLACLQALAAGASVEAAGSAPR